MKKLLFIICIALASCTTSKQQQIPFDRSSDFKWEYIGKSTYVTLYHLDGYTYIVFRGQNCITVVSSEYCKNENEQLFEKF